MAKLIFSWKELIIAFFLIGVLIAIEFAAAALVNHYSAVGEFTCAPVQFERSGSDRIILKVDCEGKEGWITDPDQVLDLIKNPRPIKGILYGDDRVVPIKEGK